MKKESWVVVANSSVARIFKLEKLTLNELDALVHSEGRLHEKDLIEDRPGEQYGAKGGTGGMYPMEKGNSPKKSEAIHFAKQVAAHLSLARSQGKIDRIYLAASPSFLGLIRQELDNQTANLVAAEVAKDITHIKPQSILEYFPIGL